MKTAIPLFGALLVASLTAKAQVSGATPATSASPSQISTWQARHARPEYKLALSAFPDADALIVGKSGTPRFLRGNFGSANIVNDQVVVGSVAPKLITLAPVFGLSTGNLKYRTQSVDTTGDHHLVYDLSLYGRDVIGGMLLVHVDASGKIFCVNGSVPDELATPAQVAAIGVISAHAAIPSL